MNSLRGSALLRYWQRKIDTEDGKPRGRLNYPPFRYREHRMNGAIALKTGHPTIDRAFRIALGDFHGNIQPWQGKLDEHPIPCILAGLEYDKPWTRDGAFNCWFAGSLFTPEVARNTLLSALTEDRRGLCIGGQYWDATSG